MKINKEGGKIIRNTLIIFIALECIAALFVSSCLCLIVFGTILLLLFGFVVAFFREPNREKQANDQFIYAPCDGKVVVIEPVVENECLNEEMMQISIFMSVTNVHANWYPVSGVVSYYKYHPGKFLVAWHPKSSTDNERTTTVVTMESGMKILFRQIAGLVARRIVNYAEVGDRAEQNCKLGFIKFGSRMDIFVPKSSEILVNLDQKVVGSQTPIAKI